MTKLEYLLKRNELLNKQADAQYTYWCGHSTAEMLAAERELEHLERALRELDKEYNEALCLDNPQQ